MQSSNSRFISPLMTFILLILNACSGNSTGPNPEETKHVQADLTPKYEVRLEAIKTISVKGAKAKFEQYKVCADDKIYCLPAILVRDKSEKLITKIIAPDRHLLKVSMVSLEEYESAFKRASVEEVVTEFPLDIVKKNLQQVNEKYLSRCRKTHDWPNLMKLQNSDRNVIYLRFDLKELESNITLRLNTTSGALDVFGEKISYGYDVDKEPSLVLNFKGTNNQLAQDNALITFKKHQNRCEEIYKHLKYPMDKYDEEMDQNASQILNYLYDFDIETSKKKFNPLEGVGYTDSSYIEKILNIKIND